LLDSENRSPNAPIETLQNRPRHKLAFRADHDFAFGAEAEFELVHNRERYVLSRGDADRAKELDDYTVVNVAVAQPLWKDRIWLTLRADNLFDADYAESFGFEQPGRTLFVGLKLK
jgi:outer membrane cobalamin receptor